MTVAKGQDPLADRLLQDIPLSVRLVIPSICYLEALSLWEEKKEYSKQFQEKLNNQINDSARDNTSVHAQSLLFHLQQSYLLSDSRLNDIQNRLSQAIDQLLSKAEMITLSTDILREISETTLINPETFLIKNDLMDNLILHCVIAHAHFHPTENKVFLSGNNNDFGKQDVKRALHDAGVKYFICTEDFLGWLESQSTD